MFKTLRKFTQDIDVETWPNITFDDDAFMKIYVESMKDDGLDFEDNIDVDSLDSSDRHQALRFLRKWCEQNLDDRFQVQLLYKSLKVWTKRENDLFKLKLSW